MKHSLRIIALLLTITFTSCNGNLNLINGIEGSGNVITEKREITSPFTKIAVSTGIEVILEQGSNTNVEVEVDDNLMQYIVTKVENGTLIVKIEGTINMMESAIVRIKNNTIEGLESSSGASIKTINRITGTNLSIKSSSGSTIKADVEYENVNCESSSGSEIKVSGKALTLETKSSSGSNLNAKELAANEITSQSSSGSHTTVQPIVVLNAKASSGSAINYVKEPKQVIKEESSGGSVSFN